MLKRCRPLLGTFVEITADCEDAIEAAFAAVGEVHRLMSADEAHSDLSQINRFAHLRPVEVHDWTASVLERALHWAKQSEGAFDPVRAGKAALDRGSMPRHPGQPRPAASHWTWLELQGRSVRLLRPACIDLGGIAKGFAVDRAIAALRSAGCKRALVNAGGDLSGLGPWTVTIVDPLSRAPVAAVEIDNEALATSAGLRDQAASLNFDHLGGGNGRWRSVTVIAPTACDADALTKIVWSGTSNLAPLLASAGAKALAIGLDGSVTALGEQGELAA